MKNLTLRGVVYREENLWLAHCLEMDIVAEGKTPQKALQDLVDLCDLQLRAAQEDSDLESALRPAPAEIWKLFFMTERTITLEPKREPANTKTRYQFRQFEARQFEFA